jgi:hypothetical protein
MTAVDANTGAQYYDPFDYDIDANAREIWRRFGYVDDGLVRFVTSRECTTFGGCVQRPKYSQALGGK